MSNPELQKITTFDGLEFLLNDNQDRLILTPNPGDMGLPRIEWQTRQAYQQYGKSVVAFNFPSRMLHIEYLEKECSRPELFAARKALLNFLHPRRGGDLTYTFILQDGTQRAIQGRAVGPGFSATPDDEWREWDINDPIIIECFDPIWFDPECLTANIGSQIISAQLVFPITFPIIFGSGTIDYAFSVTYTGTWFAYPVIDITGPCSSFVLEHTTLSKTITYRRTIAAGETLSLNLVNQTLINDTDGLDYWPYLASDSDLDSFRLEHDPEVAGGVNSFEFHLDNATTASAVVLQYQNRYIGI